MRGVYITYWPAGGGRGQNPCRTGLAQGLDLCLKYGPRALCSQFYMSQGRLYVPVVARCGPLFNFWKNRSNLFGNLGNLGNFKKCRVDDQMTKLPTSRGVHGHLVTPNIPILQLPNYLPPKAHKVIWQLQSTLSLSCILSNFRNLSNFENLGYFGNLGNSGNFGHLGNFDRLRMT